MSLNQKDIENIKDRRAQAQSICALGKTCIVNTPEEVKDNKEIQVNIGQGEGETKWKGCA